MRLIQCVQIESAKYTSYIIVLHRQCINKYMKENTLRRDVDFEEKHSIDWSSLMFFFKYLSTWNKLEFYLL